MEVRSLPQTEPRKGPCGTPRVRLPTGLFGKGDPRVYRTVGRVPASHSAWPKATRFQEHLEANNNAIQTGPAARGG